MIKALLLGSNPITKAVGNVMELFGISTDTSKTSTFDILVMVDGDNYKLKDLKGRFKGNEKVIYIESVQNLDESKIHPLFFLSEICETSRLPLENFSIVELARVINNV